MLFGRDELKSKLGYSGLFNTRYLSMSGDRSHAEWPGTFQSLQDKILFSTTVELHS